MHDDNDKPGMYEDEWACVKRMGFYLAILIFALSLILFVFGVLGPAFCRQLERFV